MELIVQETHINFEHPENAGILNFLRSQHLEIVETNASRSPVSFAVSDRELGIQLGTQPDVVTWLWNNINSKLPEDCRWVVYLRPVLVHPRTGIIFGVASGTPTYALKLPKREWNEALSKGYKTTWTYNDAWVKRQEPAHNTVLNLAEWGNGWIFGRWQQNEQNWGLAAYHFAEDAS